MGNPLHLKSLNHISLVVSVRNWNTLVAVEDPENLPKKGEINLKDNHISFQVFVMTHVPENVLASLLSTSYQSRLSGHLGFSRFIHEEFNIFEVAKHVVDLCAAPGSWSQVLSCKLYLPAKLSQDSRLWKSKVVLQLAPSLQQQPFKIIECQKQILGVGFSKDCRLSSLRLD
ncbi:uncharacterized protein [Euphorbia lathyris]|uniref:uncharacterized protein n=1 Tax=Euphorbia lathyris TaxID=212925 RepID=UPI003313B280